MRAGMRNKQFILCGLILLFELCSRGNVSKSGSKFGSRGHRICSFSIISAKGFCLDRNISSKFSISIFNHFRESAVWHPFYAWCIDKDSMSGLDVYFSWFFGHCYYIMECLRGEIIRKILGDTAGPIRNSYNFVSKTDLIGLKSG